MKIGILGGTFDPIHNGHIKIAEDVLNKNKLDAIIIIPTGNPPHKKNKEITDAAHRLEMSKIAIENEKRLMVSNIEMLRKGYVYTIDTLKILKMTKSKIYNRLIEVNIKDKEQLDESKLDIYYIIGMDVFLDLENWKKFKAVSKLCKFIIYKRPGLNNTFNEHFEYMKKKYGDIFIYNEFDEINISSTFIRENIEKTDIINSMIPENVYDYIKRNGLYNYDGRC